MIHLRCVEAQVFVFSQSSKQRCTLKVAWLRKNVCGFCQKSYTPENYSWLIIVGKNFVDTIKMLFAATKIQLDSTKMPDLWHSQLQKTKMITVSGHGDLPVTASAISRCSKIWFWQNSAYLADFIPILFGNSIHDQFWVAAKIYRFDTLKSPIWSRCGQGKPKVKPLASCLTMPVGNFCGGSIVSEADDATRHSRWGSRNQYV